MEKFLKNKEIYALFLLFILMCGLFVLFKGRLGSFFIDVSREVYIPMAMNSGSVLYKDIFNVYAPLGYQLNAFITSVFGNGLNVFYLTGLINSIFIMAALYLISKLFLPLKLTKTLCAFFITACVFSNSVFNAAANYIFPYSYSMVYALNAFLWSLLCLLYYIKKDRKKFLYAAFVLFGASLAFKYEFIFFGIVLLYFFFKNTSLKEKIICTGAFISVPFASALSLYLQGVNFEDIANALKYIQLLSKSESVKILYTALGFFPSLKFFKVSAGNIIYITITGSLICLPLFLSDKINKILNFIIFTVIFLLILFFFSANNAYIFSWTGLAAAVLAFICIIKKYRQNNEPYFVFLISSILAGIKCIFNISFNSYGNYFMPLYILCCVIYLYNTVPENKRGAVKKYTAHFFGFLACVYMFVNIFNVNLYNTGIIKTNKGIFYTDIKYSNVINRVYNRIKENTSENDRVLVLPDGAMLNYFTDRKSDNKYYYLTPPNAEIFGAENIINDLKNNPPEYIIIQPVSYKDYGTGSFCKTFGSEICGFIEKNYTKTAMIQDENSKFQMQIYTCTYCRN